MKNALKRMCLLLVAMPALAIAAASQDDRGHFYVPMREVEMEIKDFNFATPEGKTIKLSDAVKGKKLVLDHYFAAWCHNSNFDVETMKEFYEKYKDRGFMVIGGCEYSRPEELREFIVKHKPS